MSNSTETKISGSSDSFLMAAGAGAKAMQNPLVS
jgi:hypothetical protein